MAAAATTASSSSAARLSAASGGDKRTRVSESAPLEDRLRQLLVEDCEVLAEPPSDGSPFICTHSGTFHCDEALACGMLKLLPEFAPMPIVRTRDEAAIAKAHIVADVGGVYDASSRRFDHHQRSFVEPFRPRAAGEPEVPATEPIRMSSAGLVFKHFGRDVVSVIGGADLPSDDVPLVFDRTYDRLIREVDAVDNGVDPADGPVRYRVSTGLSSRVGRLNAAWNEPGGPEVENEGFKQAMLVATEELLHVVGGVVRSWLPARAIVKRAFGSRLAGGRALELTEFCPWQDHVVSLEEAGEAGAAPGDVLYVMFQDRRGSWRVRAVPTEPGAFDNRKALPQPWRGLRDEELSAAVGITDGIFVHASGFIGGAGSRESVIKMIEQAVAWTDE